MKWKKKSKLEDLAMPKFIDNFGLFVKQCCCIVWSVEKMQKVKIQKLQGWKWKNNAFIKLCSLW